MESIAEGAARGIPKASRVPPAPLSEEHRHSLEVGSANAREVYEERGVRTTIGGRDLPAGFSRRQRKRGGGILFVAHRPNGETGYSFRPDEPDPESPGRKYEQPCKALGGPGNILDVHPSVRHLIGDRRVAVVFVEGIKKADAILSAARREGAEVLVVAISGVWNWLADHKPIPDMFDIPVDRREVYICFDSDVFRNPDVQDATQRLAEHLQDRGASVYAAYLKDQADGSKTGADDYLAAGRTYAELMTLMRPYDAEAFASERLKRDNRLRLMLEDIERRFWATEWKGMGGHSSRDVYKVLVDVAGGRGKLHTDGLRVRISWGELVRMAKVSTRTLQKAIERVEEMGLIYRDNVGRKPEQAGAFVLRANVKQYRETGADQGPATMLQSELTPGTLHLRAPRLRWSSPARKGRRGVVKDTRRVRLSLPTNSRPAVKRLGKTRGAIIDVLDKEGRPMDINELAAALRRRARDLRRRNLPMLEEAEIITVNDDVVSLTENWLEALDDQRQVEGELDVHVTLPVLDKHGVPTGETREHVVEGAETIARRRHKIKSEAFRSREKPLESKPSAAGLEAIRRSHGKARKHRRENMIGWVEEETPQLSPLAVAMRGYLDRNPHDARQPAGWLGSTLWTYDLCDGKPTPAESKAAIEELGGAAYLDGKLKAAKGAA